VSHDLDCKVPGLGYEVTDVQLHDVTGDGAPDAFVRVSCRVASSSAPDQLEVFDGASDPARPTRLAVLVRPTDGPDPRGLRIRSTSFAGRTVTVAAVGFRASAPNCCPDIPVKRSFAWNGQTFVADA